MIYYDKAKNAFYPEEVFNLSEEEKSVLICINPNEHAKLLEGQVQGKEIYFDKSINRPSLRECQSSKLSITDATSLRSERRRRAYAERTDPLVLEFMRKMLVDTNPEIALESFKIQREYE